jgi:hypothetical protein
MRDGERKCLQSKSSCSLLGRGVAKLQVTVCLPSGNHKYAHISQKNWFFSKKKIEFFEFSNLSGAYFLWLVAHKYAPRIGKLCVAHFEMRY